MSQTPPATSCIRVQDSVLAYLQRVADATATLCMTEDANQEAKVSPPSPAEAACKPPPMEKESRAVGNKLICQIAEQLVRACDPQTLSLPLPPALVTVEEEKEQARSAPCVDAPENDDDQEERIPDWKATRADYLRCVLRAMPPIALDVAAQICSNLVQQRMGEEEATSSSIPIETCVAAFVLFSKWLYIAPQLAPLVAELFALETFACPLEFGACNDEGNDDATVQLIVAEAAHDLYECYAKRREHSVMKQWWSWGHLFTMLVKDKDVVMKNAATASDSTITSCLGFDVQQAIRWHAARAIGFLIDLRPAAFAAYLDRLELRQDRVAWVPHPWIVDKEEERAQFRYLEGKVSLFDTDNGEIPVVSSQQVRSAVALSPLLVHVGNGILFVKYDAIRQLVFGCDERAKEEPRRNHLILTPTTSENLSLLGAAMCTDPYPLPILVCGPPGSGKSSLVRELARYCCASADDLLELHVDEETDSKTLIGSYTTTDIPGEFTWRPGALTQAVRSGKWVLMEDVDSVPVEIQAAIVQLLEDRILPLGGGKFERCHANFRLFGTSTTTPHCRVGETSNVEKKSLRFVGKKLLNASLWRKVHVRPMAFSELKEVGASLWPSIPTIVIEAALNVLKALDGSGRPEMSDSEEVEHMHPTASTAIARFRPTAGRYASVRDFLKLLSRISHTVSFEHNVSYVTEAQRTLCLAETIDVFAASCPSLEERSGFVIRVAAPAWGITGELALNYMVARQPSVTRGTNYTEIGRAKIPNALFDRRVDDSMEKFAQTNFSLRLMESIGVCISENEPTLLVGETGCGKTAVLQHLAKYAGRVLVVQNLSLQTDSTDLLGGYRPLEIHHIARKVYLEFVDMFVSSFSRKQNADFLNYASSVLRKKQWKKLAQCFTRAAALGLAKIKERTSDTHSSGKTVPGRDAWQSFAETAEQFERQRLACDSGLAFAFTEGALVDAIRTGKWVLLDEINLASSETLQRLCGLLDDSAGSVTLTERGDSQALKRHPDFRMFAAMNPATDAGKKDLPAGIRARFSELYVDELLDAVELRSVAAQYLRDAVSANNAHLEHSETTGRAVDIYLQCRGLAEEQLVDASGHRPRYTMRTMCRALSATRNLMVEQKMELDRSMLEGFQLAFEGGLDGSSTRAVQRVLFSNLSKNLTRGALDHPRRRPSGGDHDQYYVLLKPFWLKAGPLEPVDWSEGTVVGRSKFILTESMSHNLRRLARAVAAGPWPVLLEGPTSAGKTTLIEYLAARCGHDVVRINNHEHTDIQEYTGGYSSDANGSLSFHDGLLVRALRQGHWVILDELNLAPTEVLEALNRLLDDNRELYLPEIDDTVKPHPNFRLFATQNPSGAYGGRKPLSRAFRNRFVEIHMGDIPADEMTMILEKRCACPPSHAKALVRVMVALRRRRNAHGVFLGKDGLITPRDLLRWAERGGLSKLALAQEGYMLLAERLRSEEEKAIVKEEIESHLNVVIDCEEIYYGDNSEARSILARAELSKENLASSLSVAPTRSLLRLLTLVLRCVRQKEPVLLVGETGCGKTTVVQLLRHILDRELRIVNCHATTETSDLIGGLRPLRGRTNITLEICNQFQQFLALYPRRDLLDSVPVPHYVRSSGDSNETRIAFGDAKVSNGDIEALVSLVDLLMGRLNIRESSMTSDKSKKRKLTSGASVDVKHDEAFDVEVERRLQDIVAGIKTRVRRLSCLFEWVDGPLVHAMRSGQLLLLDEMSLAEDAVLERLNSVLEPSRTLVLAEKGTNRTEEADGSVVIAHEDFRVFATMNPGGDFGKRELSPALRSRFTEIWVPQVTDPSDIEMVLGHTLSSVAVRCDRELLKMKILNYVNYFNVSVCGSKSSPCADLALSLRDVLAWARFVVDVSNADFMMNPWALFCHGACLMHLDGLGLGTGSSLDDVVTARKQSMSFLLDEVPLEERAACKATLCVDLRRGLISEERFGIHPFTIPTGGYPIPESKFDFEAPTPSLNLLRVLRAMQISKPILLEGSPGVGKTSLVAALALASGHRLVRINLSEQTDMSDLLGTDLPSPDSMSDGENEESKSGSSFKWCDGVLLRAIKRGDWVLLDELNLASQSVLEGLNSCLDHRASVFVPELGRTFHCPPTFRVFAAQNPLAQGGGRKGLPKSFLNRFTKVYVESLTEDDLISILSLRFPLVGPSLVKPMILFNNRVQREVVVRREYGNEGCPWEFNLRDVFRWCELVVKSGSVAEEQIARFARDLYLQRFRNLEDRMRLDRSYHDFFRISLLELPLPELDVTDRHVSIGGAILDRHLLNVGALTAQLSGEDAVLTRSLLSPLEAVANCVTMKWPSLIVGGPGSGKSLLMNSIAELCNIPLITVSLTPATDVNELVGSFEQVDCGRDREEVAQSLGLLNNAACTFLSKTTEELSVLQQLTRLHRSLDGASLSEAIEIGTKIDALLTTACNLSDEFHKCARGHLALFRARLRRVQAVLDGEMKRSTQHFRWVDGILVTAMTCGYWLHLENANLCSASVLDRLNPVMEQDGELLLTECGVQESETNGNNHRVVRQHSNFRIFLSMDPEKGEVSRAMRNRCVEISLISSWMNGEAGKGATDVVSQDLLYSTGVRSMQLASSMTDLHRAEVEDSKHQGVEVPSTKRLREWGRLTRALDVRGLNAQSSLDISSRVSYEMWEDEAGKRLREKLRCEPSDARGAVVQSPFLRWGYSFSPDQARIDWEIRVVKILSGHDTSPKLDSLLSMLKPKHSEMVNEMGLGFRRFPNYFSTLQNNLLVLFLGKSTVSTLALRSKSLDGFNDTVSGNLRFMASLLRDAVSMLPQSTSEGDVLPSSRTLASRLTNTYEQSVESDVFLSLVLYRLPQILTEQEIQQRIAVADNLSIPSKGMSALETSMSLYEGTIDRSLVSCPVTPMLYPFFVAFDKWVHRLIASPPSANWVRCHFRQLASLLSRRDQLWLSLQQCTYDGISPSRFLGFNESGFIVQWIWLKKSFRLLSLSALQETAKNKHKEQLDILIDGFDHALFNSDGLYRPADTLWKRGGHPRVPREANQCNGLAGLNEVSQRCALLQEPPVTSSSLVPTIELHDLIRHSKPIMFMAGKERRELLAALSMCFWASTDEVPSPGCSRPLLQIEHLCRVMSEQLGKGRRAFEAKVKASKIDTTIVTVQNMLDADELSTLRESAATCDADDSGTFLRSLLFRFAQIQVSPLAEFWCVREEMALVETLAKVLVTSPSSEAVLNNIRGLLPRVRYFVDVAISRTNLAVSDVRPYHTLAWAIADSGVKPGSAIHMLQCLLPRMMNALSRHRWNNLFNDLDAISDRLEMPPLWASDDTKGFQTNDSSQGRNWTNELRRGPPGLHRQVKSEVILRLVGPDVSSVFNTARASVYATIENYSARKRQAQDVLDMLATLELSSDQLDYRYQVQYSLLHIVRALVDFFPDGSGKALLSILVDPEATRSVDEDHLSGLLAKCEHPVFRACLDSVVSPLVSSLLSTLNGLSTKQNQGLCWIYIGLLQLNLLVPRAPLDPGMKPVAKERELDRHLAMLEGKVVAKRLDNLFVRGIPIPDDAAYNLLLDEVELTKDKRAKQERKKVERVASAPPFIDLFRELRRFFLATVANEGIPDLVRAITETAQDNQKIPSIASRECNWQATSSSFCSHVLSHFHPYEDITIPFVNAVQNLRDGIRVLVDCHLFPNRAKEQARNTVFRNLLAFPSGNLFADSRLYATVSNIDTLGAPGSGKTSSDLKRCRFALSLALLHRFDVQKRLRAGQLARSALTESHFVFRSVTSTWSSERDGTGNLPETAEALLEAEYREQFPDHGEEFYSLLQTIELGEDADQTETEKIEDPDWRLTEDEIAVLCSLHKDLFSREAKPVDDQCRTRHLYAAYNAAYHLAQIDEVPPSNTSNDVDQVGSHVVALSLRTGLSHHDGHSVGRDFHRDPNLPEVVKASRPLELLVARTSQLLTAFPGHSVLVALTRIADHVRKLPLSTTSIGKAMAGLETILRKAQEWEQHASSLVKLGMPLQDISELVARWRKLELQSWGTLLDARELRFASRARRHWPRLYGVLVNEVEQNGDRCSSCTKNDWAVQAPNWVWRSLALKMEHFSASSTNREVGEALLDLSKVMDTFFLSSCLGEFKERLDLIASFASQITLMNSREGCFNPSQSKVATMLFSLVSYYEQFAPMLDSRLAELRSPIEARLRDEVKLAKWDEQSYYALRDSIERNHRKLMKLLREYDDVLDITVSSILEKDLCHGVRAVESSPEEPCSSIPTCRILFPLAPQMGDSMDPPVQMRSVPRSLRAAPDIAGLVCDKFVSRMGHYQTRAESILMNGTQRWSRMGSETASSLCESIFDRIDALRRENTTKAMKQRALIDLFKSLKQNGFLHAKWSVPGQVREMAHLLQLPSLVRSTAFVAASEQLEILDSTDRYFQRTTAEINRLRSEMHVLGSKYMSQRETQIMLSLAEHGLTMLCQQRCVLAGLLNQFSSLYELTRHSDMWSNIPLGQRKIRTTLEDFNKAVLSVKENLKQLQFLMKVALPLTEEAGKQEAMRDMISQLDSCVSSLGSHEEPQLPPILTTAETSRAARTVESLKEVEEQVKRCQQLCQERSALPSEVLTSCITEMQHARSIWSCLSDQTLSHYLNDMTEASNIMDGASLLVQKVLLAVQGLCTARTTEADVDESDESIDEAIFTCHSLASKELAAIDLCGVIEATSAITESLRLIHESDVMPKDERDCCTSVASGAIALVRTLLEAVRQRIVEYIYFARNSAKLNYVLVRVFRVLVAKGFCADSITDDADGDGEGDVSGMTFGDDNDGTGMGEGDGKTDVTVQLESEEQLLGLKGEDADDDATDDKESKQLSEEEAKQGMEMEADFNGEMCDVPEESHADNDEGDDEELDREMGDGPDQNENIIDEKMWDESDDEGERNLDEKFEKDSGVQGESVEGELRTKEDDKESNVSKEESEKAKPCEMDADVTEETLKDQPDVNEDSEDKYEEKASGVDVRDEHDDANGDGNDSDPMEVEDGLNLDETGETETEEGGDAMETERHDAEEAVEEDNPANVDIVGEEGDSSSDSESSEVEVDRFENGGHNVENDQTGEEKTDDGNDDENQLPEVDFSGNVNDLSEDIHGIQSNNGKDRINEDAMEEEDRSQSHDGKGENNEDKGNASESQQLQATSRGKSGDGGDEGDRGETSRNKEMETEKTIPTSSPNPFQSPGDATNFWHKKLQMLQAGTEEYEVEATNSGLNEDQDGTGEFEYTSKEQASTTQVLGVADEEDITPIDWKEEQGHDGDTETEENRNSSETEEDLFDKRRKPTNAGKNNARNHSNASDASKQEKDESDAGRISDEDMDSEESEAIDEVTTIDTREQEETGQFGNRIVSDLSQLSVSGTIESLNGDMRSSLVEDEGCTKATDADVAAARSRWSSIQGETHHLARRLCEKLRLVMEPLVATKLKGDYRTGKRINMKRVIGYIASGYRKDKIWLRRTKPAKRNYRVLLAVDNSESMHKSGAGNMALAAMATLAVGMSQLEIGELGIASFGEEMKLLHPFDLPFTSESGVNVVQNFPFDEQRTRTALCVESAISSLESQGDGAAMQLVFLISDGRIERDSRDTLRRLVREMVERNILLVMIIVEGDKGAPRREKKDSIVHMKEVTFKNGKPAVKLFIEEYPFPYYMVLEDMQALPELLGDALRQWFEMLTQLQGGLK